MIHLRHLKSFLKYMQTVSSIYGFFLFMSLYPEVQAKAQAELDALLGGERLPTLADRDDLPYVDALVKEVFRFGTVVRQGIPHRVHADDIHDGYFIPKDTTIIANVWFVLYSLEISRHCLLTSCRFMCNDPRTYKDPEIFNPERFLGSHPEPDPRGIAFGFGRRICPGTFMIM
jgi:cytochrome P450